MCLSTVYTVHNGTQEKVAEYVTNVAPGNDEITLTTIMGAKETIRGRITSIDLVNNTILVEGA
jgi:predicted RNA-binding protein